MQRLYHGCHFLTILCPITSTSVHLPYLQRVTSFISLYMTFLVLFIDHGQICPFSLLFSLKVTDFVFNDKAYAFFLYLLYGCIFLIFLFFFRRQVKGSRRLDATLRPRPPRRIRRHSFAISHPARVTNKLSFSRRREASQSTARNP